jgi:hypothetical protein
MTLLQRVLQIIDEFLRSKQSSHISSMKLDLSGTDFMGA